MTFRRFTVALVLSIYTALSGVVSRAEDAVFTTPQLLPLLRRNDLAGLAHLIRNRYEDVSIDLGGGWLKVPFRRFRIEGGFAMFQHTSKVYFVFCPVEPPTLRALTEAKTLNQIVELLAPVKKTMPEIRKFAMQLPLALQELESKEARNVEFHTAYLLNDHLAWIDARLEYNASERSRTGDTPFQDATFDLSISTDLR